LFSLVDQVSDAFSQSLQSAKARVRWDQLASSAGKELETLAGRSVVLAVRDQLVAAAALLRLDGWVRRMVLVPPDLPPEHLDFVTSCAAADLLISDEGSSVLVAESALVRHACPAGAFETEWVLLTSGTTGRPKLVVHTLRSLTGAIRRPLLACPPAGPTAISVTETVAEPVVWSTFYDIRRYGGLQIFLRAALAGSSLVLTEAGESTAEFLTRAGAAGVTHISGTPSHWRRALMSPAAGKIKPRYVRLSGEIADGAVLEQLKRRYPEARVAHAFASTEAGVAFEVTDGEMGVPASALAVGPDSEIGAQMDAEMGAETHTEISVEMKIEAGTLRVRSARTARCYLGEGSPRLKDDSGFVDTGDVLQLRAGRYYFAGRHDGTINVGGQKVHPEEVEAVINGHPEVQMSLVRTRKNPITGSLVVADVVLRRPIEAGAPGLQQQILAYCRGALARHKVPVAIQFVPALELGDSGKLVRRHA
jgi:acyl-CoA synthetase (AMP-forming)/AMP-acid ligase II